jgi:hexosaminidase
VFPFECVHIGGDECPKNRWKDCPKCQARIKAEGLKDEQALQAWLTRHMVEFLAKRGKRTIGWAEYLGAGVPTEAMGMVWLGWNVPRDVSKGASAGHDMIVTPTQFCYVNHSPLIPGDPYPYGGGGVTLENCYTFDPCKGVTGEAAKHVIGGQGCQWTEYSWNQKDLEWKYWPRLMALAEVFWLGEKKPGLDDFKRRAAVQREALIKDGVNCGMLE